MPDRVFIVQDLDWDHAGRLDYGKDPGDREKKQKIVGAGVKRKCIPKYDLSYQGCIFASIKLLAQAKNRLSCSAALVDGPRYCRT